MAQRLISRALAVGVIAGAIMSATGTAQAEDNGPPSGSKGCVVEHIDDNGNTVGTSVVPEGTVIGLFHCRGGQWSFGWFPFDALVSGSTGAITVDPKGLVRDAVLEVDTRDGRLEVREMHSVVERLFDAAADSAGRAVVVTLTDRRGELSRDELAALLEGRDVPGVRILATADPRPDTTVGELGESGGGGGATERKVVYRISKNWIFVGDVTCTTNKDGSKTCRIKGTIKRG